MEGREGQVVPFPGTPQILTLLKQDQPARKEAIVRSYASSFPSASTIRHRPWLGHRRVQYTFCFCSSWTWNICAEYSWAPRQLHGYILVSLDEGIFVKWGRDEFVRRETIARMESVARRILF